MAGQWIWANLRILLVGLLMLTTTGSVFANGYDMGKDVAVAATYAASCDAETGCGSSDEDPAPSHCAVCCSHQTVADVALPMSLKSPAAQSLTMVGGVAPGLVLSTEYPDLDPPRA